ncbi:hypothetical protein DRJ22_03990 [Candidatus Woesearchaeota archaeon]|nr:MAG: hypothetical protein DRJ22_03990 [Candidatus Woesearchaeota archaeon]
MKRGQGLPITVIVVAALGILVLVVIGAIFGGQIFKFGRAASVCPGKCVVRTGTDIPLGGEGYFVERTDAKCIPDFETELTGTYVAQNMPRDADVKDWMCERCCVPTG